MLAEPAAAQNPFAPRSIAGALVSSHRGAGCLAADTAAVGTEVAAVITCGAGTATDYGGPTAYAGAHARARGDLGAYAGLMLPRAGYDFADGTFAHAMGHAERVDELFVDGGATRARFSVALDGVLGVRTRNAGGPCTLLAPCPTPGFQYEPSLRLHLATDAPRGGVGPLRTLLDARIGSLTTGAGATFNGRFVPGATGADVFLSVAEVGGIVTFDVTLVGGRAGLWLALVARGDLARPSGQGPGTAYGEVFSLFDATARLVGVEAFDAQGRNVTAGATLRFASGAPVPTGPSSVVPEPRAVLLIGSGLMALVVGRRRRREAARSALPGTAS